MISLYTPTRDFGNQLIWNNSFIRGSNQTVFYSFIYNKVVKIVKYFFNDTETPLSFQSFKERFLLTDFPFTLYLGLINSIPTHWREAGCERLKARMLTFYFL